MGTYWPRIVFSCWCAQLYSYHNSCCVEIFGVECCVMECCVSLEQVSFRVFSCWTSEYSCRFFWRFACLRFRNIKLSDVLVVFVICLLTFIRSSVGAFLASSLWHSRIVCRIMKIVSELVCILLVFVQKMSGKFLFFFFITSKNKFIFYHNKTYINT